MEPGDDLGCDEHAVTHVQPNLRTSGAKFLLKTRKQHHICQATSNKIVGNVKGLWLVSTESIKRNVKECMETALLNSSSLDVDGILK
jgi:hypothetical protein